MVRNGWAGPRSSQKAASEFRRASKSISDRSGSGSLWPPELSGGTSRLRTAQQSTHGGLDLSLDGQATITVIAPDGLQVLGDRHPAVKEIDDAGVDVGGDSGTARGRYLLPAVANSMASLKASSA